MGSMGDPLQKWQHAEYVQTIRNTGQTWIYINNASQLMDNWIVCIKCVNELIEIVCIKSGNGYSIQNSFEDKTKQCNG